MINKEEKSQIVQLVQNYFEDEMLEGIGNLATEQLVDFITDLVKPHIYNQALFDVNKTIKSYQSQLEDALFILEKPTRR
ncbi:DUF2164 domain-containing protein [Fusibacter bizertensis]|jgi:Uncharacterized conserved protein|uniref:DUF2164 domain-containing protein n=1 Tax=Fusibacter bizertensis TaxID=1488331 RepID=A0ABT6NAP5_9FIRM|nr:DUF2164 domain-containing protein [Fusibacter bizertensis]MDH8677493.1 DUF2164 domain-containing protein [Fusibacter bizertensis]